MAEKVTDRPELVEDALNLPVGDWIHRMLGKIVEDEQNQTFIYTLNGGLYMMVRFTDIPPHPECIVKEEIH